jgi:hypothetical protein
MQGGPPADRSSRKSNPCLFRQQSKPLSPHVVGIDGVEIRQGGAGGQTRPDRSSIEQLH